MGKVNEQDINKSKDVRKRITVKKTGSNTRGTDIMSRVNVRVNDGLKNQANDLFQELGLDMSTAINIFLKQSVREQRLPFQPTLEPMNNEIARRQANNKVGAVYETLEDFMSSLDDED